MSRGITFASSQVSKLSLNIPDMVLKKWRPFW